MRIIASGNLDELEIARLVADGAPIDSFGVGAALAVSEDAPCLDVVYKLVAYDGRGRMKLAAQKTTLPDPKQVFRQFDGGVATHDVIGLASEAADGQPLLEPVMRDGKRLLVGRRSLDQIRAHAERSVAALPSRLQTRLNRPRRPTGSRSAQPYRNPPHARGAGWKRNSQSRHCSFQDLDAARRLEHST